MTVDLQEQMTMLNLNELTNDQLAELAKRHELIGGFGRIGPLYILSVEDEDVEFDPDAAARFLRGMLRAYGQWHDDVENVGTPTVRPYAALASSLN